MAVVAGEGVATLEDGSAALSAIHRDEAWLPHYGVLVDVRDLARVPAVTEARAFAEMLGRSRRTQSGRIAVVANQDAHFGMARLIASTAEQLGVVMQVFRDPAQARGWLGTD